MYDHLATSIAADHSQLALARSRAVSARLARRAARRARRAA